MKVGDSGCADMHRHAVPGYQPGGAQPKPVASVKLSAMATKPADVRGCGRVVSAIRIVGAPS